MNYILFVTIVMVVMSLGSWLYNTLYPNYVYNKLFNYLKKEQFEAFEGLYGKKCNKLSNYDNKFLLLNKALLQGKEKEIKKIFDDFQTINLNEKQQAVIYSKAFYFYLSLQDYGKCKKYFNLLKDNEQYDDYHDLYIVYDTYIEKGHKYLEELLAKPLSPSVASLIAINYSNMGNREKAKEYEEKIHTLSEEK